jgi:hypothetical protein
VKIGHRDALEKGTHGATAQQLANRACEKEREEGSEGLETGADRSAPLGSEREEGKGARGQTAADRRGPPVRAGWRAGAWPGWAELGWFGLLFLFLFLWIF